MVFHVGENLYDTSYICVGAIGIFFLAGYIGFIYISTHKGDFYRIRRWKAANWISIIPSIILWVFLSTTSILNNSTAENFLEALGLVANALFSTATLIIPFTFVLAIGTHYQLKWWPNSETYLDKIWKNPNKESKSPIQDI